MARVRIGTAPNAHFGAMFVAMLKEAGLPAVFITPPSAMVAPDMPGDIWLEDGRLLRIRANLDLIEAILGGFVETRTLDQARADALD